MTSVINSYFIITLSGNIFYTKKPQFFEQTAVFLTIFSFIKALSSLSERYFSDILSEFAIFF